MSQNPLQKYFRQPKMYISLPSKGMFYSQESLIGDYNSVPVFAMTGMDEIIMKTPDALFSGEATVKLIESCCPYIKNGQAVPSLDLDVLLVAIRMATYGEDMTIGHTCRNCGTENEYTVKLPQILEQYSSKTFNNKIDFGEVKINLKPLSYKELSNFNIENFKLQKVLSQLVNVDDLEKQKYLDEIYQNLAKIQLDLFTASVESIEIPDTLVNDREFIKEWMANISSDTYNLIKDAMEVNKNNWKIAPLNIKCTNCGTEDSIEISMDQSNFFGQR
jgi:hypothetical protein